MTDPAPFLKNPAPSFLKKQNLPFMMVLVGYTRDGANTFMRFFSFIPLRAKGSSKFYWNEKSTSPCTWCQKICDFATHSKSRQKIKKCALMASVIVLLFTIGKIYIEVWSFIMVISSLPNMIVFNTYSIFGWIRYESPSPLWESMSVLTGLGARPIFGFLHCLEILTPGQLIKMSTSSPC